MTRIFSPLIVEDELKKILLAVYKSAHISMYFNLDSNRSAKMWSEYISGEYNLARNYPFKRTDVRHTPRFVSEPHLFSQLSLLTLKISDAQNKNPWLLPRRISGNDCDNFAIRKETTQKASKESHTTMAEMYAASVTASKIHALGKNGSQNGSCFTCSRDRNSHSKRSNLMVYDSTVFRAPKCLLSQSNLTQPTGFEVHIQSSGHSEFKITKIRMGQRCKVNFLNAIKRILPHNKKLVAFLQDKPILETDDTLKEFKIKLHYTEKIYSTGLLTEIERRGFRLRYSHAKEQSGEINRTTEQLSTVRKIADIVRKSCDPLRFQDIQALHEPITANMIDPLGTNFWPLQYISTNIKTLKNINAQMSLLTPSERSNNLVFREDEQGKNSQFTISISEIRFWS